MITNEIRKELQNLKDLKYGEFQRRLIPNINPDVIIGVRTPALRELAKKLWTREDIDVFLNDTPHTYFEENQLHAFIVSKIKDFARCMDEVCRFLPFVDNWATCDQMSPEIFKKHRGELPAQIRIWIASGKTYTVRFAVKMLMEHFLGENFDIIYPQAVADISCDEYYVSMMRAWYFATALAKNYESVLPFIEEKRLDFKTHNRAIQKATESFRITAERKEYLKSLKIPARQE